MRVNTWHLLHSSLCIVVQTLRERLTYHSCGCFALSLLLDLFSIISKQCVVILQKTAMYGAGKGQTGNATAFDGVALLVNKPPELLYGLRIVRLEIRHIQIDTQAGRCVDVVIFEEESC